MALKKRAEMTKEEVEKLCLQLRCEACNFDYTVPPAVGDPDAGFGYYSSDKDFCPKCGASDIVRRAA